MPLFRSRFATRVGLLLLGWRLLRGLLQARKARRLRAVVPLLLALSWPDAAAAQHSPRIADDSELGVELRFSDEVITLAGLLQAPIAPETDVRGGFGIGNPDDGDSEVFLTGGLRHLLTEGRGRFPLAVALDGQLDLLFLDDTRVLITAGPSFGGEVGRARALTPFVQPLFVFSDNGRDSDTEVGLRGGADYEITETVEFRGRLLLDGDTELTAGLWFEF
jgi:hypothetical protein